MGRSVFWTATRWWGDAWWRLATTTHPRTFSDRLLSACFQGGAVAYRAAVRARNVAYDRDWLRTARLPCPVISIGNLVVGGTGKTACVELVTTLLLGLGARVAILSRGYGGRLPTPYWLQERDGRLLLNGEPTDATDGLADEPQLLAWRLPGVPVLVGRRRAATGEQAWRLFKSEVIVLDDGLQHRQLRRDCDIVLVSAAMPLGGWALLPRGPMREPLGSLRRAHVIILTKSDQSLNTLAALQERLRAINPDAAMCAAIHEPQGLWDAATAAETGTDALAGRTVHLVSSIGDPDSFEQTVRQVGATVLAHDRYPDHYRYRPGEAPAVFARARRRGAAAVVTTEKDAVRIPQLRDAAAEAGMPVWVLRVRMRLVSGETLLHDRLAAVCDR